MMTRKASFVALVIFSSAICSFAADPASSDSEVRERGPWAALKRTWSGTVDGVESVGRGAKNIVGGVFGAKSSRKSEGLEVSVKLETSPVSLASVRQVKGVLAVHNQGKHTQLLSFPTGQRVEAVLRDQSETIVGRSSEDRSFGTEPALITVNPGERLEFEIAIPTRSLSAGKTYTLDAAVTNQEKLRSKMIVSVVP
ncbi:MAG: BsuPI-related putative proteinase inhibitor [Verrucomicrobiota bacterium]